MRSNLEQLTATAGLLGRLLEEFVFVGGAVTCLLVTDTGAGWPRATLDVDAIAEVTTYAEYVALGDRLRAAGFVEDTREGAPVCRWVQGEAVLDVLPLDEGILGFSNRWYREAIQAASTHRVGEGLPLRVVTAPYFLATKLEAFHGRGGGDYLGSHDLEDIVFVVDGRPEIVEEVRNAAGHLRDYLAVRLTELNSLAGFLDALPGYLFPDAASQSRLPILLERLRALGGA